MGFWAKLWGRNDVIEQIDAPVDAPPDIGKPVGLFSTDVGFRTAAARRQHIAANWPKQPKFVAQDGVAMDDAAGDQAYKMQSSAGVSDVLFSWYVSQGFIGYQTCALMAQHWLVAKVCKMTGDDAVQGGWKIGRDDGAEITADEIARIKALDRHYDVERHLMEASYYRNIFGVRAVLFMFDGLDYELPFDPLSVTTGSYRGMTQIDPYWMSPMLTGSSITNPLSPNFYVPDYWQVSGRRIHKSHFVFLYGADVSDILKPSYLYGGIPLTQRIYERVYAAERTANEAPQLALAKRLTVKYTDMAAAIANQEDFEAALQIGVEYQDNFGVMVAGLDDRVERHDTALGDLDTVIMTQYQLVAAIAEVPATKLLGSSPKGFGAAGDYEIKNYHEKLQSIQRNDFDRILERHYAALALSDFGTMPKPDLKITVEWLPLNKPSAKELAELNNLKATADATWAGLGAVDNYDVRKRLIEDESSGYTGMVMEEVLEDAPQTETDPNAENLGEPTQEGDIEGQTADIPDFGQ